MRIAVIAASLIGFVLSLAWLVCRPGFDSAVALAAATAALFAAFLLKDKAKATDQIQRVSGASVGIQAGRDAKIGKIENHRPGE